MASKIYRDVIGSTLMNTETSFGAKAERKVFVRVDDTDNFVNSTLLGRAIEKAVEGELYHPEDPSLPLQRAKAIQIGKDTVEVLLEYQRKRYSSGPLDVPTSGGVVYNSRARMATNSIFKYYNDDDSRYEWFDAGAQKDGDPTKADDKKSKPRPRTVPIAEEVIKVPAVLNTGQFAQLQAVKNDIGKLNSNTLRFAGHTFLPNTMLLVGVDTDWQSQQTLGAQQAYVSWGGDTTGIVATLIFVVQYHFRYRPTGWADEAIRWNGSTNEWEVVSATTYSTTNMSGYPI